MNTCINCQAQFVVTDRDRQFYQKIDVPEPTNCPDCRQQRRLAWRNERWMYKRRCDFSNKEIISMYPPDCPFKVYEQNVWWSDKWNALEYGRDFDFNRPFFEQFRDLQLVVPRSALVNKQSHNSEYTNHAGKNKNCYLSGCIFGSENCHYSDWIMNSRDLIDCSYMLENSEFCYETYYSWGSYECFYCDFIKRCQNLWFCYDCINCKYCFLSSNLRNKKYCYENKQLTKEQYEKKMKEMLPMSNTQLKEYRTKYITLKDEHAVRPATYQLQSEHSTGDILFSTKNCASCFDCINMEDSAYCFDGIDMKDSMDIYHVGWAELMYECHAISNGYNCHFCHFTYDNSNATYCDCTQNCKNVFGCCGVNQEEYCILNKKYSKEEYFKLRKRIVEHMRRPAPGGTGETEYGEFFPIQFSPFAYNQARVQEYYPLTTKEAKEKGMPWSDYESPVPESTKTINASQLPELITDIPDDILNWAITCETSKKPFKIIKPELELYRKIGLPIPRRHPEQRYLDRIAQRNTRKLWQSQCTKCHKEIETSFSPESRAQIYCQECYLKKVY